MTLKRLYFDILLRFQEAVNKKMSRYQGPDTFNITIHQHVYWLCPINMLIYRNVDMEVSDP